MAITSTPATTTLAASPALLLTARTAVDLGMRPGGDKYYVRVRSGVYALRSSWKALPPWSRYLARVHAYALVHPGAVFCLESAAVLLGLPVFGEPQYVHVLDVARTGSRRYGDLAVHAGRALPAILSGPISVTAVLDTTVALARVLPPAAALAVADAAARMLPTQVGRSTMLAHLDADVAPRGRAKVRWVSARVDPRAESPGESVSRAVIEWCGFPEPELQQWFHYEDADDRVDMYWPRYRAIGEADGDVKYADPQTAGRVLRAEKEREARLRRYEDGFARWSPRDAQKIAPLRITVSRAGVPLVRPADEAMLATLKSNPRSMLAPSPAQDTRAHPVSHASGGVSHETPEAARATLRR